MTTNDALAKSLDQAIKTIEALGVNSPAIITEKINPHLKEWKQALAAHESAQRFGEALKTAKMDEKHDHLNELLEDDTPVEDNPIEVSQDRTKASKAFEEIIDCVSSILSSAHKNGVTELAKFKFKEQAETVRTELQRFESSWFDKKAGMADAQKVCDLTHEKEVLEAHARGLEEMLETGDLTLAYMTGYGKAKQEFQHPAPERVTVEYFMGLMVCGNQDALLLKNRFPNGVIVEGD